MWVWTHVGLETGFKKYSEASYDILVLKCGFTWKHMMDFMENLQWPSKTAVSRRFWRFTKMVRKTVRFVFSQNPLRGRFFSLNEPLKNFFFWKITKRTVFRAFWSWEVTNSFLTKPNCLPIINFFLPKSSKINKCSLLFVFHLQISFFVSKVHWV